MSEKIAKRLYIALIALPLVLGLIFGKDNSNIQVNNSQVSGASVQNISHLSPFHFNEKISSSNIIILDVRTAREYAKEHIPNSINIDFYSSDFLSKIEALDSNLTYLVYCKNGNEGSKAVANLNNIEIENAYSLDGGIDRWIKEGYDVTTN